MRLWHWAGRVWAKPGVETALLALQDEQGQSVPLLLWALWLSEAARTPSADAIEAAVALCRTAETHVIRPLRDARRAAASSDRAALLARELDAERDLMDQLEMVPVSIGCGASDLNTTLAAISALWGRPLDPSAFRGLIGEPADVG